MTNVPEANKPFDVICFTSLTFNTKDKGEAHIFLAKDMASEFVYQPGFEEEMNHSQVMKQIQLLMNEDNFKKHYPQSFTLVIDQFEEIQENIRGIIKPYNGSLIFNRDYVQKEIKPVIDFIANKFNFSN